MPLERGVQPQEFLERLTPRRFSGLLESVLEECAGASRVATLRHLYARRALRFGGDVMPPPSEAVALARRWLSGRLPELPPQELDMSFGLRRLTERLGLGSALAEAWWKRLDLEVPLEDGRRVHWLLEHEGGAIGRAVVVLEPPAAELRLRMPERQLARLYAVDGRSGLQLLARALKILGGLELLEGRRRPSPLAAYRVLRRALRRV